MKNNVITIGVASVVLALIAWMFMSLNVHTAIEDMPAGNPVQSGFDSKQYARAKSTDNFTPAARVNDNVAQKPVSGESIVMVEHDVPGNGSDIDVVPPPPPAQDSSANRSVASSPGNTIQDATVTTLQEQFYAEPYDEMWAAETEQQLMNLFFKEPLTGNQLVEAACRSTFCRIDISHADTEAEEGFLAAFVESGQFVDDGEQGYYHRESDVNGVIGTVFYYARKGYQLPVKKSESVMKN